MVPAEEPTGPPREDSPSATKAESRFARFARELAPPFRSPRVRLAAFFFCCHLLCLGWIASSEGFLVLGLVSIVSAVSRGELQIRYHPLFFPFSVFLVASTASAIASGQPLPAIARVGEFFLFTAFVVAFTLCRSIPPMIGRALNLLSTLVLFISFYGIVQFFFLGYGSSSLDRRITGPTAHVMTMSGIILPVSLLLLVVSLVWRRPWHIVATVVTTFALILTFTRGAWLGWLAGFAVILLRRKPRAVIYAVPLLIFALTFSPMSVFGRVMSSFNTKLESNFDRIRMAEAGVEMIRDHPLFGVGPSEVKDVYPLYRKHDAPRFRIPHLHNNLIQLWAERGVLALASYFILLYMFLRMCWRTPRGNRDARMFGDAGLAVGVAMAVAGLFEFNFGDSEVLITTLDLYAIVLAGIEVAMMSQVTDPVMVSGGTDVAVPRGAEGLPTPSVAMLDS